MPDSELIKDGERQMRICNACRYCEGYCAVFPAMEQRRVFTKADLTYLANLCFDCRDCYYACQYAPPHEFGVNIPKLMAELRTDTYREFTWPVLLSGLFNRNALAVGMITVVSMVIIFGLVLAFQGPDVLLATHLGEGAFYRVVPFVAMTVPPSLIALYGLTVFIIGALRFWRETRDRFFLLFALSFCIEGANRFMLTRYVGPNEDAPVYYLVRLVAYGLIIAAIVMKNRGVR